MGHSRTLASTRSLVAPADWTDESRRVVTVVRCDLVGPAAPADSPDPELRSTVALRYAGALRFQIEAYGGFVQRCGGDAVTAVFGGALGRAGAAAGGAGGQHRRSAGGGRHGEDARHALAAAFGLLAAVDRLSAELHPALEAVPDGVANHRRLRVRIGVQTGPVRVDHDGFTREPQVFGETVDVAGRLEQNAQPGQIVIGETTRMAVGGVALTEPVGQLALGGRHGVVQAHRLIAMTEGAPELLRRADTLFVDRTREITELDRALFAVSAGDGAQLVTVYGEAGIGKTRLIREWVNRIHPVVVHGIGHCRPYEQGGPLAPLADAVRQLFTGQARQGATRRPAFGGNPPLEPCAVADHLGVAGRKERLAVARALAVLTPGLLRDGTAGADVADTRSALVDLLTAVSRSRPVVLVLDDWHRADDELLDLVDRLVRDLHRAAVLVLCGARHDLLGRGRGWGSGNVRSRALLLSRFAASGNAAPRALPAAEPAPALLSDMLRQGSADPVRFGRQLFAAMTAADDDVSADLAAALRERGRRAPFAMRPDGPALTEYPAVGMALGIGRTCARWLGRLAPRRSGPRTAPTVPAAPASGSDWR